jgi:hypothetical protein
LRRCSPQQAVSTQEADAATKSRATTKARRRRRIRPVNGDTPKAAPSGIPIPTTTMNSTRVAVFRYFQSLNTLIGIGNERNGTNAEQQCAAAAAVDHHERQQSTTKPKGHHRRASKVIVVRFSPAHAHGCGEFGDYRRTVVQQRYSSF